MRILGRPRIEDAMRTHPESEKRPASVDRGGRESRMAIAK